MRHKFTTKLPNGGNKSVKKCKKGRKKRLVVVDMTEMLDDFVVWALGDCEKSLNCVPFCKHKLSN